MKVQDTPLLQTKLFIPSSTNKVIPRPKLLEHINESLEKRLSLVCASAGYGKTTLVSYWLYKQDHSVAWFSLDEIDNDLERFWHYTVAALQTVFPELGEVDRLESSSFSRICNLAIFLYLIGLTQLMANNAVSNNKS